jgi:hypothetical protein
MFICDQCKRVVGPSISEIRVVTKIRKNVRHADGKGMGDQIAATNVLCPFCAETPNVKKLYTRKKTTVEIKEVPTKK